MFYVCLVLVHLTLFSNCSCFNFNSGSLFQLFTKISTHENNPLYGSFGSPFSQTAPVLLFGCCSQSFIRWEEEVGRGGTLGFPLLPRSLKIMMSYDYLNSYNTITEYSIYNCRLNPLIPIVNVILHSAQKSLCVLVLRQQKGWDRGRWVGS